MESWKRDRKFSSWGKGNTAPTESLQLYLAIKSCLACHIQQWWGFREFPNNGHTFTHVLYKDALNAEIKHLKIFSHIYEWYELLRPKITVVSYHQETISPIINIDTCLPLSKKTLSQLEKCLIKERPAFSFTLIRWKCVSKRFWLALLCRPINSMGVIPSTNKFIHVVKSLLNCKTDFFFFSWKSAIFFLNSWRHIRLISKRLTFFWKEL